MGEPLHLVIGTRGSRLALVQANAVALDIRRRLPHVETVIRKIRTQGDLDGRTAFAGPVAPEAAGLDRDTRSNAEWHLEGTHAACRGSRLGDTGLFVKELERSLIAETIDLAVHSMKDVPTEMNDRLLIAAVPSREDARDALVPSRTTGRDGAKFSGLRPGATVGTSSPRRRAQLLRLRPDLQVEELRGNLDTRLRKLDEGQYDAIVVAAAGLNRLGLSKRASETFDVETLVPAVGQGAIAIQVRRGDIRSAELVRVLNVPTVETAVLAERAFLAHLGGGCRLPIGGHAIVEANCLTMVGCVTGPRGKTHFQDRITGDATAPQRLGARLAERLLDQGAAAVLE